MFANRFEWQEKLARTQSPPCNLSLFFSVSLSLTQVFALHCNHVHVHGGCFLSVAGRQIASIWLKGICYISPQHEKCRHTHTSFFFPFECLEMMFVYLDFICQSRQRPHCAFANKSALMVQLHYILIICCFMMKKHIPRGYTFLWQPTIYLLLCCMSDLYRMWYFQVHISNVWGQAVLISYLCVDVSTSLIFVIYNYNLL